MIPILVSLLPVLVFLAMLIFLDNYKLVSLSFLITMLICGVAVAIVCYFIISLLSNYLQYFNLTRYLAPAIEESAKAILLIFLLKKRKIAFLVDAAIIGFAVGSGFALAENIYYLHHLQNQQITLWVFRGFGTAMMHGGTTAIFAMLSVFFLGKKSHFYYSLLLPGWLAAVILHILFNQFWLPPLYNTLLQILGLPILMLVVFSYSEKQTQKWLQTGFDSHLKMLEYVKSGKFAQTRQGVYLSGFKNNFSGEVVVDIFCYLRVFLELALRAKGLLLLRESGLKGQFDPEVKSKFVELEYLEKNIGKTGMKVLKPLLYTSSKELWQIYFLQKQE